LKRLAADEDSRGGERSHFYVAEAERLAYRQRVTQ
jgi:hypothetical protein